MSTYSFLLVDFISVIVLFTLLVYSKKDLNLNIDNTINKIHIFALYLVIVIIIFKIFISILSMYSYNFLIPINRLFNSIIITIYLFVKLLYVMYICEWFNVKYNIYVFLAPSIFNLLLCILNFKYDILFKINIYNFYSRESFFLVPFFISLAYLLYALNILKNNAKYISKTRLISFFLHITLIILTDILDKIFNISFFISPTLTISIVINYLIIHRSLPYYKPRLNCYNKKALSKDLYKYFYNKVEFTMIFFNIKKFKSISNLLGSSASNECILDFVHALLVVFKNLGTIFHLCDDKFIIIIKNNDNDKVLELLSELDKKLEAYNKENMKPYLLKYHYKSTFFKFN